MLYSIQVGFIFIMLLYFPPDQGEGDISGDGEPPCDSGPSCHSAVRTDEVTYEEGEESNQCRM